MSKYTDIVEQSLEEAVEGPQMVAEETSGMPAGVMSWLQEANSLVPPYWSRNRDIFLGKFWKQIPHVAVAVYAAQAKLLNIPMQVKARNPNIDSHAEQADEWTTRLTLGSEFGATLNDALAKFYEDLLTQDNGAFMEIIGDGDPNGPIVGRPIAVRHLDSQRCMRTSNPMYPMIYTAGDGARYRFHYTRVIMRSQMPSSRMELHGVGLCAVSRCIELAQTLLDIIHYKQERLGSMPAQQLLLGKGLLARQIMAAFLQGEEELRNRGFSRYARTLAIGSIDKDVDIKQLDLNHLEPFDEEVSTRLGMALISSAFGLEMSEIWFENGSSGSQTEARLRNSRSRGKLPAQVTREMSQAFNSKVLPPHLYVEFDFRDDEEDQQRALIADIRGRGRERDLGSQAITVRVARERMRDNGEITDDQFIRMELEAGRLRDGSPLQNVFFRKHPDYLDVLNLGVSNPLDVYANDPEVMLSAISLALNNLHNRWSETISNRRAERYLEAYYALEWLADKYKEEHFANGEYAEEPEEEPEEGDEPPREETEEGPEPGTSSMGRPRRPGTQKAVIVNGKA